MTKSINININTNAFLIVVLIIFLYLLFYTNYIVDHSSKTTTTTTTTITTAPTTPQTVFVEIPQTEKIVQAAQEKEGKKVYFDMSKNEVINYDAPELVEYQRRSACEYPSITRNQLNKNDCAMDGSCLIKYNQEWFKEQRNVRSDLPGYNGHNYADFGNTNININRNQTKENYKNLAAIPSDLCRSCVVGTCNANGCYQVDYP